MTPVALGEEQSREGFKFLQTIQNQLTQVSGIKDRPIRLLVTTERKRFINITPTSVSFSYGFLKNMQNINQLIATMAHMTAHISLDYVPTPPVPEDEATGSEGSVGDYIKSAVRPQYPDKSNPPQATGSFHKENPGIIERPRYQNKEYNYAINKADILLADEEHEADKTTVKILSHANLCPSDFSRMMHYFYENPQILVANRHFALETDQWQRVDAVDRLADPKVKCSDTQNTISRNNAQNFEQMKVKILKALK